jgi:lipopolysaccharide biosynthesis protein WzzE
MTQPLPGAQAVNVENELDIRGLFRALWAGKIWIAGMAVLFALIVLVYAFFARQEWSATAITDRPTVNMLGGYYSQQQFLRNLDIKANLVPVDQPSAMDQAYKEFIMQQGPGIPAAIFGCKPTITNSASRAMPARTLRCWTI